MPFVAMMYKCSSLFMHHADMIQWHSPSELLAVAVLVHYDNKYTFEASSRP